MDVRYEPDGVLMHMDVAAALNQARAVYLSIVVRWLGADIGNELRVQHLKAKGTLPHATVKQFISD